MELQVSNPLTLLMQIRSFGRPVSAGQHYRIKYRKLNTPELAADLERLKTRYPELLVYKASTGYILFGGTFSTSSNFMHEIGLVMGRH